ncbi:hypothetical protein IQ16_01934 [Bradyrhizobium huanghuaihaiense]|uniref:Uncharacterized protein n=1 Tax=Bradyrhizobium huanghuaihaiense TaxID=990078 RepID=A0A562RZW3_9BRAD|nr:hypothetical protein [Bradyrhizobium huanghuaihaiense]TWI73790.1 hypothetical protein IQ16_01934 [Bradyrhizobium huanghuaihaiense]
MTIDAKAIFDQRRQQREAISRPARTAPSVPAAKGSPFTPEGAAAIYAQRRQARSIHTPKGQADDV